MAPDDRGGTGAARMHPKALARICGSPQHPRAPGFTLNGRALDSSIAVTSHGAETARRRKRLAELEAAQAAEG